MKIKVCCGKGFNLIRKQIMYLGFTFVLFGGIIGVSYAMFFYTETGTQENSIVTGKIVVNFNESTNIRLIDRYPETDIEGIANTDPKSISTFTVSSDIVGDATLNYAIGLSSITEGETLKSNYIKIYMTKNGSVALGFTEGVGKTIKSFETSSVPGYFDSHALTTGTLTGNKTDNYTIKAWVSDDYEPTTEENTTDKNYTKTTVSETFSFKIKLLAIDGELKLKNEIFNAPELASNMIPVYYDYTNEVWKKADESNKDETNKWYSYNNKMWANAVTVTDTNRSTYLSAEAGTTIPLDDINTMFVWIPRFSAEGNTATYNGTNDINNPGAFDITFVDNITSAHDAFTFGTQELNGFWVGKFETSSNIECTAAHSSELGNGCNLTTIRPKIIPNVTSWRGAQVATFFNGILNMKEDNNQYGFTSNEVDTHMMKNNEWGALAYFTQSIYGRCSSSTSCTEVGINNSFTTGYGSPAGSDTTIVNGSYNTVLGLDASTTGNIYGIYDMSGGNWEYVMGVYSNESNNWSGSDSTHNSGFNGCLGVGCSSQLTSGLPYPERKYYNSYTNTDNYNIEQQHALTETKRWYRDDATFVSEDLPWFIRGGHYKYAKYSGLYNYGNDNGFANKNYGSRTSLIVN